MLEYDMEMMLGTDTDTIDEILRRYEFKLYKIFSENNGIIRMVYNGKTLYTESDMIGRWYIIDIHNNKVVKAEYKERSLFNY